MACRKLRAEGLNQNGALSPSCGTGKPQLKRMPNPQNKTHMNKTTLIHALGAFISQRSGIDFRNYASGDYRASRESFLGDYRPILKHGKHARRMLDFVSRRDISAEDLVQASRSGRLSFVTIKDAVGVSYVTGQYFPTEYRRAACSVLARAIWEYFRTGCNYSPEDIRKAARREFGRAIASAWF